MGFLAGFVSSSATIAALGMRACDQPDIWSHAVAGALASSIATVVQYAFMIVIVDPTLLWAIVPALAASAAVAGVGAAIFAMRARGEVRYGNQGGGPFRLGAALGFAAVFSLVGLVSSALQGRFGNASVVFVSAVAGLIDAHSTAGAVASLHRSGALDTRAAELAILTALVRQHADQSCLELAR